MLKLNSELRAQAREALQGNWVMAAVAALIYSAIVSATSYLPLVGTLLVGLPVAYGFTILMFSVIKGAKDIDLGILFEGQRLQPNHGNRSFSVYLYFLVVVATNYSGHH